MDKKSLSFVFLFLLVASVVSACQTQPTQETQQIQPNLSSPNIVGIWSGEAQWLCGHSDPPWVTTMEFKSDGSFVALLTAKDTPTSKASGTWSLSGNSIEIKFPTNVWSGIVSNGKMEGTFKDDRDTCTGNWSLKKN